MGLGIDVSHRATETQRKLREDGFSSFRIPLCASVAKLDPHLLAFRELEAFTRALLTVLLTLFGAGIAREQSGLFELLTQLGVELEQRARDAVTHRAGLASNAAAVDVDHHVEFVDRVGQLQRL